MSEERDLELTPEQFRALGKVTHNASRLEAFTAVFVWSLIGDYETAQLITNRWSFDQLMQVAERLFPIRYPDHVNEFDAWRKDAKGAMAARGELVHSWWSFDPQLEKVVRMRQIRGKASLRVRVVTDEEFYDAAKRLTQAAMTLVELSRKLDQPIEVVEGEEDTESDETA